MLQCVLDGRSAKEPGRVHQEIPLASYSRSARSAGILGHTHLPAGLGCQRGVCRPSVQPHELWLFCVSRRSSPTPGHADVRASQGTDGSQNAAGERVGRIEHGRRMQGDELDG